jgi:hypothetical protein
LKHYSSVLSYENFTEFFKRVTRLDESQMGLGSHKLLDFLSFAANMPLHMHPQQIFNSGKFSKTLKDFIGLRKHMIAVQSA